MKGSFCRQLAIAALGVTAVAGSVWIAQGVEALLGVPLLLAAQGATAFASWRYAPSSRYVWACLVAAVVLLVGIRLGNAWFERSLIAEVAAIDAQLASQGVPRGGRLTAHGPIRIRAGSARESESGEVRVSFGLPDGSVVRRLTPAEQAAECAKACTRSLPNGWHRRSRCADQ